MAACVGTTIPEVDSVLTTAEVQQLIEQQGAEFRQLSTSPVDSLMPISSSSGSCSDSGQLYGVPGGAGELTAFLVLFLPRSCNARHVRSLQFCSIA